MNLLTVIQPELILIGTACALFLMGVINRAGTRKLCAVLALACLVFVFGWQLYASFTQDARLLIDPYGAFRVYSFAHYIKMLSAGVGAIFILMAWPSDRQSTGNSAMNFGTEAGEFYALMLLAIAGIFIVAGANDIVLLFLGIELASIPTYIMVSVSRPLPVAQEAGVKYFFLGAMSAAIMLFGFSYLYGTTGLTNLRELADYFSAVNSRLTSWQVLAVVMLIAGFAFKMAAVPLHFYAGDVYQGAATPVTAFLSYVPKTSGLVALLKILFVIGGAGWLVQPQVAKLIWIIAVLTMSAGNVLGLLQTNVKRMLAYSSVAHSGYLLVGVATMVGSTELSVQQSALAAVLFYLASYGIMNAAAFGVLMLLPAKPPPAWDRQAQTYAGGSAETLDDIAGAGIRHPGLGLMMAVACFSLIGLPLTVGFFGKFYLIQAAWRGGFSWLIILMMVNAAISAGYYLRIVATMFLRAETTDAFDVPTSTNTVIAAGGSRGPSLSAAPLDRFPRQPAVLAAVALSVIGTLLFGVLFPATELLHSRATEASAVEPATVDLTSAAAIQRAGR